MLALQVKDRSMIALEKLDGITNEIRRDGDPIGIVSTIESKEPCVMLYEHNEPLAFSEMEEIMRLQRKEEP